MMNNDIAMNNVGALHSQDSSSEHVVDIEVAPVLPGRIDTVGIETAITRLTEMLQSKNMSHRYVHNGGYDGWIILSGLGVISLMIWLMFTRVTDELKEGRNRVSDSINGLKAPCNCVCPKQMICNSTLTTNSTMTITNATSLELATHWWVSPAASAATNSDNSWSTDMATSKSKLN
jgi:hypothetical protein